MTRHDVVPDLAAQRRRATILLAAFALAIVAFRGRAWFLAYGDPTIGLYLHVGLALLRGHLPYTTAWDYRPPGLFAIYAAALAPFAPWLAWNVLTSLAFAVTALGVGLLARECAPRATASAAWCAAAFFVLLAPENDGIWGAAEVEISAFIAWALWFAMRARDKGVVAALWSGLLAGLALQCKLSALPLVLLPAAILVMRDVGTAQKVRRFAVFLGAFAAPMALEAAVYARAGALPLLLFGENALVISLAGRHQMVENAG